MKRANRKVPASAAVPEADSPAGVLFADPTGKMLCVAFAVEGFSGTRAQLAGEIARRCLLGDAEKPAPYRLAKDIRLLAEPLSAVFEMTVENREGATVYTFLPALRPGDETTEKEGGHDHDGN